MTYGAGHESDASVAPSGVITFSNQESRTNVWEIPLNRDGTNAGQEHRILAHALVDIVWVRGSGAIVTGPDPTPRTIVLDGAATFHGVRFHTGHGAGLLGVPAAELTARVLPLSDLWGACADRLAEMTTIYGRS